MLTVPGGGGRTTADLKFDVDFGDIEKLVIFSQDDGIDPDVVTTQDTLGMFDDGKFHIQGLSFQSTSNINSEGLTDVVILYYNEPITGPFKLRARVRLTSIHSNSTSKGIQIGAFVPSDPPNFVGEQVFGQKSHIAGMQFRTSIGSNAPLGEIRYYYNNTAVGFHAGQSTAGGFGDQILFNTSWKTEYIFEVSRDASSTFRYAVLNSKTGAVEPNAIMPLNNPRVQTANQTNTSQNLFETLRIGENRAVYLGFALMGSSAEISEITIWDNYEGTGDPLFKTPDTEPAYVPVEQFTLTFAPNVTPAPNSNPPRRTYTRAQVISGITLTPGGFYPSWSDNRNFEWLMDFCEPAGAFSITGTGTPYRTVEADGVTVISPGVFDADGVTLKATYPTGRVTANGAILTLGTPGRAVFKAVARDLDLDNFEGEPSADYSLQQLLAQFSFEIVVE